MESVGQFIHQSTGASDDMSVEISPSSSSSSNNSASKESTSRTKISRKFTQLVNSVYFVLIAVLQFVLENYEVIPVRVDVEEALQVIFLMKEFERQTNLPAPSYAVTNSLLAMNGIPTFKSDGIKYARLKVSFVSFE